MISKSAPNRPIVTAKTKKCHSLLRLCSECSCGGALDEIRTTPKGIAMIRWSACYIPEVDTRK